MNQQHSTWPGKPRILATFGYSAWRKGQASFPMSSGKKVARHMCVPSYLAWSTQKTRCSGRNQVRFWGVGSEKGKVLQAYSAVSHLIKAAGEYETKQPTKMYGP